MFDTGTKAKIVGPKALKKNDPRNKKRGELQLFAYTLKDRAFGEFHVKNSANAWWLDSLKVEKLFDAYKFECTDIQACVYAGISEENLRYFRENHEDFSRVKAACKQVLSLKARQTFGKWVENGDREATMTTLRKNHKQEFAGQLNLADPDGKPLQNQNAVVFVNFEQPTSPDKLAILEEAEREVIDATANGDAVDITPPHD
jgi:hypothetical protein